MAWCSRTHEAGSSLVSHGRCRRPRRRQHPRSRTSTRSASGSPPVTSAPPSPIRPSTAHPPRASPEAPVASSGVPVTLLHTSDWHVGKAIRGASRADEHRAVLAEIAELVGAHDADVVVVAGDLFDSATPSPESEQIVYEALLALASTGATVVVIAGNHDNARGLRAVAPLLALGNV